MVELGHGSMGDAVTVSLPDVSVLSVDGPSIVYRRNFNRPTGLAAGDSVVVNSGLLPLATLIRLNGIAVDVPREPSIDITDHLQPHNELTLTIPAENFQAASTASAALEITGGD